MEKFCFALTSNQLNVKFHSILPDRLYCLISTQEYTNKNLNQKAFAQIWRALARQPARNCGLPIFLMHPSGHEQRRAAFARRQKAIQTVSALSNLTDHHLDRSQAALAFFACVLYVVAGRKRPCVFAVWRAALSVLFSQRPTFKTTDSSWRARAHRKHIISGLWGWARSMMVMRRSLLAPIFWCRSTMVRFLVLLRPASRESIKEVGRGLQATNNCTAGWKGWLDRPHTH